MPVPWIIVLNGIESFSQPLKNLQVDFLQAKRDFSSINLHYTFHLNRPVHIQANLALNLAALSGEQVNHNNS